MTKEEFIAEENVDPNQFINVEMYEEKNIVQSINSSIRKQGVESKSMVNQSDINMKEIVKKLISQDGEKWICNNCGKEARTKGNIELHAEIHIEGLEFNCNKCDKTFRSRNLLSHHRKRCQ